MVYLSLSVCVASMYKKYHSPPIAYGTDTVLIINFIQHMKKVVSDAWGLVSVARIPSPCIEARRCFRARCAAAAVYRGARPPPAMVKEVPTVTGSQQQIFVSF